MTFPSFEAFYEAVHGYAPYPWQRRLAAEVLERTWTGLLLDIPTGAGKTSALDVAVYCLARDPQRMPRRTVLVVDRRIVVDQVADHARAIQRGLEAPAGAGHEVGLALRRISGDPEPESPALQVAVMRGGMPRDNDWARWPTMPVLGVSTVDQVGSRLLFRGYGVSSMSASIHAGLIGNDTLILLDEVHLAVPFAQTLDAIQRRYRRTTVALPTRFEVVAMSATVREAKPRRFEIGPEDRATKRLADVLSASKQARLVEVKVTGDDEARKRSVIARQAVEYAVALQQAGAPVVAIVVNRVDTARLATAELKRSGHAVLLITGRMRPIERDEKVRTELKRCVIAGRDRAVAEPLVVVATQCIEAGADLDFDGIVTECASLDALRQRFGRVDRRGVLGSSRSVILGRSDLIAPGAEDPVYGEAIAYTWDWLERIATDHVVDFGIQALPPATDVHGAAEPRVLAPAIDAPTLLPAHLDAWAQTSLRIEPDPDVGHWLHGPQRPDSDVQVVWRVIPPAIESSSRKDRRCTERLEAVRPSTLEAITVPIGAAKRWLGGGEALGIADTVAGGERDEEEWRDRHAVEPVHRFVRWSDGAAEVIKLRELRPGDVLVVDVSSGGIARGSFDPDAKLAVVDLGDLAQLRGRGIATLRLDAEVLRVWGLPDAIVADTPRPIDDETMTDTRERIRTWMATWPEEPPTSFIGTPTEWGHTRTYLAHAKLLRVAVVDGMFVATARIPRGDERDKCGELELSELVTEDENSSFRGIEVTLAEHSTDVKTYARRFADALALPDPIRADLELAGWLHDIGKADPRFQRWLVGGDEIRDAMRAELLAKSKLPSGNRRKRVAARRKAGYPPGYRHELLSLAMAEASGELLRGAHDRELVLHLVASHHGWCRPFAAPLDDAEDLAVAFEHGGVAVAASTRHRRARLDSGVTDRFWMLTERYGWWGLAWLEAVLRLADHRASQDREETR